MIKASELRIGNRVLGNNSGEIFCLTAEMILHISKGRAEVEPIPLTPEILLACGFEKDGMDYSRTAGELKLTGFFFEDYFVTMLMGQRLVDLKYLHQLQNLYHSLTEDELIYKPTPQPA